MKKIEFDYPTIYTMYRFQNMTAKDIGRHFNIGEKTMGKFIRENNILRAYDDIEWLKSRHFEMKLNLREMAKLANCSHETIGRSMKKFGIKPDLSISNSKYKQDGEYFSIIDTQEKAYWLGFIMADGYVGTIKNNLSISLKREDRDHLQKFLYAIKSDREIDDYQTSLMGSAHMMSRINIFSRDFVKPLIDLGFTSDKSLKEFIPSIRPNLIRHFIRGYFDGDGSFYYNNEGKKRRRVNILGGESFLNNLMNEIQDREEIHCKIRRKNGDLFELYIDDSYAVLFLEWIYFNSSIHLDRKYEKFINFKAKQYA